MTGDYKWLSVGQLFGDYEIELENAAGLGCWNHTFVEIAQVVENDPEKIIDFSQMHRPAGVTVLSGNSIYQNKILMTMVVGLQPIQS